MNASFAMGPAETTFDLAVFDFDVARAGFVAAFPSAPLAAVLSFASGTTPGPHVSSGKTSAPGATSKLPARAL